MKPKVRLIEAYVEGASVVTVNDQIVYHEDDDKYASNKFYEAEDVAKNLAKALGVKYKRIAINDQELAPFCEGGDLGCWNFYNVVEAAKTKENK